MNWLSSETKCCGSGNLQSICIFQNSPSEVEPPQTWARSTWTPPIASPPWITAEARRGQCAGKLCENWGCGCCRTFHFSSIKQYNISAADDTPGDAPGLPRSWSFYRTGNNRSQHLLYLEIEGSSGRKGKATLLTKKLDATVNLERQLARSGYMKQLFLCLHFRRNLWCGGQWVKWPCWFEQASFKFNVIDSCTTPDSIDR